MHRIIEVTPLQNFNVWIKFADGNEGIVDLSDIAGKGVFALWSDPENFKAVFINPENHTISWPGDIDLCPDTFYAEITGTSLKAKEVYA